MVLNDAKINAGVVSERLSLGPSQIKDVSMGYTCGVYPYDRLKVFVPGDKAFLPARTGQEFVRHYREAAWSIRVCRKAHLKKWRQQLVDG